MKKQLLFAALISTTLLCNSCGAKNNVANDDILPNDTSQTNNILSTNTTETNGSDTQTTENLSDNETPNDNTAQQDNQSADNSGVVIIDSKTVEDQDTADDGTVIYSRSYTQPLVTIANNSEAAEKINTDIQSRIDAFTASDSIRNESHEYYELSSKEEGYDFFEYNESLGFEKVRSDNNVISFIMTSSGYMGGAHGYYNSFGLNYLILFHYRMIPISFIMILWRTIVSLRRLMNIRSVCFLKIFLTAANWKLFCSTMKNGIYQTRGLSLSVILMNWGLMPPV